MFSIRISIWNKRVQLIDWIESMLSGFSPPSTFYIQPRGQDFIIYLFFFSSAKWLLDRCITEFGIIFAQQHFDVTLHDGTNLSSTSCFREVEQLSFMYTCKCKERGMLNKRPRESFLEYQFLTCLKPFLPWKIFFLGFWIIWPWRSRETKRFVTNIWLIHVRNYTYWQLFIYLQIKK